jgi:hypothetical protein
MGFVDFELAMWFIKVPRPEPDTVTVSPDFWKTGDFFPN